MGSLSFFCFVAKFSAPVTCLNLGRTKLGVIPLLLWFNAYGNVKPFEEFHSNIGELVIIKTEKKLSKVQQNVSKKPASQVNGMETRLSDEEIDQLLFGNLFSDELMELETEPAPSLSWFHSLTLGSGVGYADNPLYANYNATGSAFGFLDLETFSLDQGNPQYDLLIYFFAEGKKFTDLGHEDVSGLALGQIDYSFSPTSSSVAYGLRLQHTYYDQGMDFSELDLPYRMKITSNRSAIHPRIEWHGRNDLSAVLDLGFEQEGYANIEDESMDFQMTLEFSGGITDNWEWTTALKGKETKYKDRRPKTESGAVLNGNLKSQSTDSSFALQYDYPAEFWERTVLKIAHKMTVDSQGGYYDYHRWRLSLSQDLAWQPWTMNLSGGFGDTRYTKRKLSNQDKLHRQSLNFDLGISRFLGEDWKTFFNWNHEEENSNDSSFSYENNFWTVGMSWEK